MRDGALMPELNEYQPACAMNGICNALPPGALFFVVDAWGSVPTLSLFAYKGTLCNDQTSSGSLCVIFNHQFIRDLSLVIVSIRKLFASDRGLWPVPPEDCGGARAYRGVFAHPRKKV